MKSIDPKVGQWWIRNTGPKGLYETYYICMVTDEPSEIIAYTASSEFIDYCGYSWCGPIDRFVLEFDFLCNWLIV